VLAQRLGAVTVHASLLLPSHDIAAWGAVCRAVVMLMSNTLWKGTHHQLPAVQPLVCERQPPKGIPLVRVDAGVVDHEVRPIVRQQPGQDLPELPA
jgi:hypothetical protein